MNIYKLSEDEIAVAKEDVWFTLLIYGLIGLVRKMRLKRLMIWVLVNKTVGVALKSSRNMILDQQNMLLSNLTYYCFDNKWSRLNYANVLRKF